MTGEPAELELLVRSAARADAGFRIIRHPVDSAALRYCPQRAPEEQWEARPVDSSGSGEAGYLIKSKLTGSIVELSPRGWRLWQLMDGRHSVQELAATYFFEFGSLDFDEIRALINHLRDAGLIDAGCQVPWFVRRLSTSSRRSLAALARPAPGFDWSLSYTNADALVERVHRAVAPLMFSAPAFGICLLVVELGLYYFASATSLTSAALWGWAPLWQVLLLGYVAPLVLLITPLHELAHAIVCKHHGRRVASMGVHLVYGVFPLPYADVTDVWLAPGLARVETYFAGPLSTLFVGSLAVLAHHVLPAGSWAAGWTLAVALASYAVAFVTLYPFFPVDNDGYYILSDLSRCFSLRAEANEFVNRGLPQALRQRRRLTRREWLYVAYSTATAMSAMAVMVGVGWGLSVVFIMAICG